mmetsp:Transcript_33151/g.54720  ORF Transcript_33151/g.54720 Transcript_33151/m.54720 type:complete len:167 (-) Transcript_33151:110-610(-)
MALFVENETGGAGDEWIKEDCVLVHNKIASVGERTKFTRTLFLDNEQAGGYRSKQVAQSSKCNSYPLFQEEIPDCTESSIYAKPSSLFSTAPSSDAESLASRKKDKYDDMSNSITKSPTMNEVSSPRAEVEFTAMHTPREAPQTRRTVPDSVVLNRKKRSSNAVSE